MLRRVIPGLLMLACFAVAGGQPTPPKEKEEPKKYDPALQKNLDPILDAWELNAKGLEKVYVTFKCEKTNPNFKNVTKYDGTARFLRDEKGYKAYMELRGAKPEEYEKVLFTGSFLYVFSVVNGSGIIDVYPVDEKQRNKAPDDGPLALLFGMTAKQAKQRYEIAVDRISNDPEKWYTYLHVRPNFQKDLADFIFAEVAIYNHAAKTVPKNMPARISYIEPNKNQVTWTITEMERNGKSVDPEHFVAPREKELPKGWKIELHKQAK